jgi:hypothetical protein
LRRPTIKSATAYPCSIASQSQQSVVGKSTAKSNSFLPSHHSNGPSKLARYPSLGRAASSDPPLRGSNDHRFIVGVPRAQRIAGAALLLPFPYFRACLSFSLEGGLFGLPLRATFSPAHPLARRDVPVALARAFRFSIPLCMGVAKAALYCAHRATTVLLWGLCEQEGHLAAPFPSLDCPFHRLL